MKFQILRPKRHDLQPRTHPNEAYININIYVCKQAQIYYIDQIDHIVRNVWTQVKWNGWLP